MKHFQVPITWLSAIVSLTFYTGTLLAEDSSTPLKTAFAKAFRIGAAINEAEINGTDKVADALLLEHFNSITPENTLKWESVHPEANRYDFTLPDQYVDFGVKNHLWVIGHTLVWHNQTPSWVFKDAEGKPLTRDALLARMSNHIHTVVGRYKGRINGWDVVNEALEEDGSLRQSQWYKIIGEDFIEKAFQFAHEADPAAELHYNDYSLENEPKRKGAIALIKKLKAAGAPITAIGLQCHVKMDWPSTQLEDDTLKEFTALGVKIMITELDVDVLPSPVRNQTADITLRAKLNEANNPYTNGLPDAVQAKLTQRYAELFQVFLNHKDAVTRVTTWGVKDDDSWLNTWPVRGRVSYPLLFGRDAKPKPAVAAIIAEAQKAN